VGIRLLPALTLPAATKTLLLILLLGSTLLIPAAMIKTRQQHSLFNTIIIWCGLIFMGLLSSLFVFTLLRDVLIVALLMLQAIDSGDLLSPAWYSTSAALVVLVSLLLSGWGFIRILMGPATVTINVPIRDLPSGLQGFTLVQLSDIHIGPTIKHRFLERVVRKVNQLQADAVVITGDLVDGQVSQLGQEVAPLQHLQSRHGSFFVTGNHEYYSSALDWIALLQQLGIRVLQNQHQVLQHQQEQVVMAGVTDYSAHHFFPQQASDPQQAMANAPADAGLKVLLAHQPRSIFAAQDCGAHIQLSGHTHGGQFWPWNHFVPLQQPFTSGLHRFADMWIYVSRGTGYWGPPKRFGAPPEITLIRFTRADG